MTIKKGNQLRLPTDSKGFEPLDAFTSMVFKTIAFDHSASYPYRNPFIQRVPIKL